VKAICARHGKPSKFFSKHFHIAYQAEEYLNPTIAIKVFECHFYLCPLIMLHAVSNATIPQPQTFPKRSSAAGALLPDVAAGVVGAGALLQPPKSSS
jgi:hypothetical protein